MFAPSFLLALALAQSPAPVLTLDEAMKAAETQNQDLKIARARLTQAQELHSRAWAGYLPKVSLAASYTRNSAPIELPTPTGWYARDMGSPQGPAQDPSKPVSLTNPPGQPTNYLLVPSGMVTPIMQMENQWMFRVEATQPLIAPAAWAAIKSAYLAEDVATLNVANARREILFNIAQTYYSAASLREIQTAFGQLLDSATKHEADAKAKLRAGVLTEIGYVRAQIDRTRTEQDLVRARNAYASAKLSLATLLSREADFEVIRPADPRLPDGAPSEDEVLSIRPDVLSARKSVELAEKQSRVTEMKYLPNVGLSADWEALNFKGLIDSYTSWAIRVGLSWTLWDGGAREAEAHEDAAKRIEAEATRANVENKAREEVRRAQLDLESARANKLKASEQLKLARQNYGLIESTFHSGMATPVEVSDALAARAQAEVADITESLNAQLAALKLLKALGKFAN